MAACVVSSDVKTVIFWGANRTAWAAPMLHLPPARRMQPYYSVKRAITKRKNQLTNVVIGEAVRRLHLAKQNTDKMGGRKAKALRPAPRRTNGKKLKTRPPSNETWLRPRRRRDTRPGFDRAVEEMGKGFNCWGQEGGNDNSYCCAKKIVMPVHKAASAQIGEEDVTSEKRAFRTQSRSAINYGLHRNRLLE